MRMPTLPTLPNLERFPRLPLGSLPTDLEPMPRLGADLGGPRLWVKRDDLTGLGGGNKARPLEYLMADAQTHGARRVVTFAGSAQSNHLRATAIAARRLGMEPILVVFDAPPSTAAQGNTLLTRVLDARVLYLGWLGKPDPTRTIEASIRLMAMLATTYPPLAGRRRYIIPVGGFSPLGALGYAVAAAELTAQTDAFRIPLDYVVTATGTGATAAGLLAGFRALGRPTRVIAIDVGRLWKNLAASIVGLANRTLRLLDQPATLTLDDLEFHTGFAGAGYGEPTRAGLDALRQAARTEGLLLEPVYTSKALAALITLSRAGHFRPTHNVVFLHTGGAPALYAYRDFFQS